MATITESLIRKRAEHNEGEIFSLEELSLHQLEIEKIEHIDKWCRHLQILYLQSNLIEKIENVGRLKKLQYLNLALNNIKRIENLEGCESLQKLDLTVNFVGEITSVESLSKNQFLEDLYLTGNPCVNYEGYREFVIATLPQLQRLDGKDIEKSERIKACQVYEAIRPKILQQQNEYEQKLEKEEEEDCDAIIDAETDDKNDDENFWNQKCDYTPESRREMHEKMRENREKKTETKFGKPEIKRQKRYFNNAGDPMNVNEGKIDFVMTENDDDSAFILDVSCYKYLDSSLIDVDVQPEYVRVTLKGEVLQLVLREEVSTDNSKAQRSQTTGHLVVTMPKLNPPPKPTPNNISLKCPEKLENRPTDDKKVEKLDFDESKTLRNTLANISHERADNPKPPLSLRKTTVPRQVIVNPNFVDDPDVPPLI